MASTVTDRLELLVAAKADIASAIEEMGGSVPVRLSEYGGAIRSLPVGSGDSVLGLDPAVTTWPDCVKTLTLPSWCLSIGGSGFVGAGSGVGRIDLAGVTAIGGSFAFASLSALTEVTGSAVTDWPGFGTFVDCGSLSSVSFPKCRQVGENGLAGCTGLTEVSFPVATEVKAKAFYRCSGLVSVSLPLVTEISDQCFTNCIRLSVADFPKATRVGGSAFGACYSLASVSLPMCESVGYGAFAGCGPLKPGMSGGLGSVYLPVCSSVAYAAFLNCKALSCVSLPKCTYIGSSAFYSCSSLTTVDFRGASAVPTLASTDAFAGIPSGARILVPEGLYASWKTARNWTAYESCISTAVT